MFLLESISWKEANDYFKNNDIVILPIGSTEQHGPHNPLGTDFLIAEELAKELSKRTNLLVLPTVPYGVSFHHSNFPGTISIDEEIFTQYVYNIVKSLKKDGINKIFIINGHGGNYYPLLRVSRLARMELNMIVYIFQWWTALAGKISIFSKEEEGHAGAMETSLIAYFKPGMVNMLNCEDEESVMKEINEASRYVFTDEITSNGVFGKSCSASREKGLIVMEKAIEMLLHMVEHLKNIKIE